MFRLLFSLLIGVALLGASSPVRSQDDPRMDAARDVRDRQAQERVSPSKPRRRTAREAPPPVVRDQAKGAAIGIIAGRMPGSSLTQAAFELSSQLDAGERYDDLRILPILGRGATQNLRDLLHLPGVDVALLQSDVFELARGDDAVEQARERVRFVTTLFPQELHVLARPEIRSLDDLAGKRVGVESGGGPQLSGTMEVVLRSLGVAATCEATEPGAALDQMRRGEMAAQAIVAGKPSAAVDALRGEGFRLLSVPYRRELQGLYLPARITAADYPALVDEGQPVETIAVGTVMAVLNWPEGGERHRRVARFVERLFERIETLHGPGLHPKWRDVNLAAALPGWTRFKPAQAWLDRVAGPGKPVVGRGQSR